MTTKLIALLAAFASTLGMATSASAASNIERAACISLFTSNSENDVGATVSFLAEEARPFGTTIAAMSGQQKYPCE
jgi:hypothetical protein